MHGKLERMKRAPNELRRTFSSLMPTKWKKNVRKDENAKPYFDAKCIFRNIRGVAIRCIFVSRAISYHAPSPGENPKWNKATASKIAARSVMKRVYSLWCERKTDRERETRSIFGAIQFHGISLENRILVSQWLEVFTLRFQMQISKLKIEAQQLSKINVKQI